MSPQQTKAHTDSHDGSVAAKLLPSPGPAARVVYRCVLFASATVLASFVLSLCLVGGPLLHATFILGGILFLPLFLLSFAFMRSEPRLAIIGFTILLLFILAGVGIPAYVE